MNSKSSPSPWLETCPECGAEQWSPEAPCWLCGLRPDGTHEARPEPVLPGPRPEPPRAPQPFSFSLATMLLITTMAAVWFGLLAAAPGLAILACILLLPALVRTTMVVRRRENLGQAVSPGEKVALTVTSMFVSLVILTVAIVASIGTFCAVCLSAGNQQVIPIALLMAAAATIAICIPLVKWVKARYRRDVGKH